MIFLSCASFPAGSVYETVEGFTPEWQELENGVDFINGRITNPQLEFWALRINLTSPSVRIVVSEGKESAKVSSFVRDNSLLAGINAVPFDISSNKEGQPIKNLGLVVSGGKLITPSVPNLDALVFSKDGRAVITKQRSIYSFDNVENAIGGFYQILSDGKPAQRTIDREDRHPRSAAGVSANGERLYLLVIDGRRSGSLGATEEETALVLRSFGCENGINFDGGGSSALALRSHDGKVRTVNSPVHNGIPGTERAVAACLGVAIIP